jgi:mediator of RNA polymerase II transcription subunit 21
MKSKVQVPLSLILQYLLSNPKLMGRQLLTIMSRSIAYLTSRVNFIQVSDEIPVTKQRNPEKVDPPDVFEGSVDLSLSHTLVYPPNRTANKKELVEDLMMKAKQIEYLIQSLPIPEPEEVQVRHTTPARV